MAYWLFKSEPDEYSIDDLATESDGITCWNGIRNFQARNLLRDEVAKDDEVLFYHSSCPQPGIAGIARIVRAAYPDPSQFDPDSPWFDGKASSDEPRWFCVDVRFVRKFTPLLTGKSLRQHPELSEMVLFRQGRLSIQPVTQTEWKYILGLTG